jgi:hypothetical protein
MSAKTKQTVGSVLAIVGYALVEIPFVGYALIALGAALSYSGARQAQKEAEARARTSSITGDPRQAVLKTNIRGSYEHHTLVFGKARVGGIVAAQGTHTPSGASQNNEDLYIAVDHSLSHAGGCEGIADIWVDDRRIASDIMTADPNSAEAQIDTALSKQFYAVAFNDSVMVALSGSSGNDAARLAVSFDHGASWINLICPDRQWRAAIWAEELELFVAVATSGIGDFSSVMTSPDGINWTLRTAASDNKQFSALAFNGTTLVAVAGNANATAVMTSADGITWTTRTPSSNKVWSGVAWNGSVFCAVASSSGTDTVMTSPDGITWTSRTASSDKTWQDIAWSGSVFVAVGSSGTGNRVMTSPDGITWTDRVTPADNFWFAVTYGGSVFVAVAQSGTGNRVMTSPDGITWTIRTSAADLTWRAIAWDGTQFVAVSDNEAMTSGTGITWTSRDMFPAEYGAIRFRHYRGTGIQNADATLVANGIEPDTAHRRGIAWTWCRFRRPAADADFSDLYHFSVPRLTVELKGIKCYDPRLDSTQGGTDSSHSPAQVMRLTDPYSWLWSDNPILQAATYSIMAESDGGWGIPTDQIDWGTVTSAANICDETKTVPGGTRNRFVGNGVLLSQDKREINLQKILDACLGRRIRIGGKFKFYAAAYRAPTFTIDDTWLAGGYKISTRDPLESVYNAVRVNYNDATLDYKTIDAPPYTNGDYEDQDGGQRVWRDLNLPMVSNTYDAQYLSQILGKKSRYQMTIDLICNLKALDVEVFESGFVDLPGIDLSGRVFRIESWNRTRKGIAMTLQEDHTDIYDVETMQVP